jgi:multiple sugar transport system substrate-binding protein
VGEGPAATEEAGVASPTPVSSAEPSPDDESVVTIRFAANEAHRAEFEALAAEFHEQNPLIQIEFVAAEDAIGDDHRYPFFRLVSAADTVYYLVFGSAISQGLLRDLAPFIEADASFEPDDFFPGMLEAFAPDGGTWALPTQAELSMVFYHRGEFAANGVPFPTLDWTRDDFLAAAQALTLREGKDVSRYGFVDRGIASFASTLGAAGDLAGDSPRLDTPAIADGVRWYTDLALEHGVMPRCWVVDESSGERHDVCGDLIRGGKAAMWSTGLYQDPDVYLCGRDETEEECDGRVGVVPVPTDGEPVVPAWMQGYFMSAGTAHPQESWRWLRFLTHRRILWQDYDFIPPRFGYYLPARRSVAEGSGYFDQFDGETLDVVRYAVEHLYIAPPTEASYRLRGVVQAVFDGAPVEEALAEAQAALEEALAEAAQATPVAVVVAAPQPEVGPTIAFARPPSPDEAAYRALADEYNADNPDVQVQIIAPNRVDGADCFAGALDLAYESMREGRLNLQSLVDGDAGFPLDDFHPRFLDVARYQGDLWGVPTQADVRVVFYNRDLFDAAGEPYPEAGWTLADFLARALALTAGSGDEEVYGFVPLDGHAVGLRTFLALQGVDLWDGEGRPRFDAPDVVAAVTWYANLALAHGVTPVVMEGEDVTEWGAGWEEREALVRGGRAAMWTDVTGVDRGDVWPPDSEVGMAPLPLQAAGAEGVTDFIFEGLFISDGTTHPQACWEWIEYLSVHQELVNGLPARGSVLESAEFAARVGEEAVEAYRATLAYGNALARLPATPDGGTQLMLLNEAFESILAGADPEAALLEAQGNVYN